MRYLFSAFVLAAVAMATTAAPRPVKECSGPECSASRYSTVYGLPPSTSATTTSTETPDVIIFNGARYRRETPSTSAPSAPSAQAIITASHHEETPTTAPAFGFCSASRESRGICGSSGARRGLIRGFFSRLFGGCGG